MSEWRRFEKNSRSSGGRYWEIRLAESVCELRYGVVGEGEATHERIELASGAEARATAKQKIRTKQRAGWVEIEVDAMGKPAALVGGSAASLEQAIVAEPDSLEHWAVYADFLQAHAPIVGERVALGLALHHAKSGAERAAIESRIEQLEHTHARELFGVTVAGLALMRGFEDVVTLERRHGMIVGATLRDPDNELVRFEAVVAAVLELPIASLLAKLHIEVEVGHASLTNIVELVVARRRPYLRELALCLRPPHFAARIGEHLDIATVLDVAPALERLELHGRWRARALEHPCLRALKLSYPGGALSLSGWRMPRLDTLHVIEPGAVDWSGVELPALRHLLIEKDGQGHQLIVGLARAPWLAQLESLVLVGTHLTDLGIAALLEHSEAFASLQRFDILDVFVRGLDPKLSEALPRARVFEIDAFDDLEDLEDWAEAVSRESIVQF